MFVFVVVILVDGVVCDFGFFGVGWCCGVVVWDCWGVLYLFGVG